MSWLYPLPTSPIVPQSAPLTFSCLLRLFFNIPLCWLAVVDIAICPLDTSYPTIIWGEAILIEELS